LDRLAGPAARSPSELAVRPGVEWPAHPGQAEGAERSDLPHVQREFAAQEDYARRVERYRYIFAALLFLMTGGAIVYGARLRRKIKAAEVG